MIKVVERHFNFHNMSCTSKESLVLPSCSMYKSCTNQVIASGVWITFACHCGRHMHVP